MDDEKLIECVRKYPCIYDMSDEKYMDVNLKCSIWKKISKEVQQSDDSCKKRWVNIRDQFKRNLNKHKTKSGQSGKLIRKYKYQDLLQFLLPHIQNRDPLANTEVKNELENSIDETERAEDKDGILIMEPIISFHQDEQSPVESPPSTTSFSHVQQPSSSATTSRIVPVQKQFQRRNPSMKQTQTTQQHPESASQTSTNNIEQPTTDIHPIDAFFQGLLPTIKRFSPYHQHIAKGKIFSVVQQLEYEQLQSANLAPTTAHHGSTSNSAPVHLPPSPLAVLSNSPTPEVRSNQKPAL